MRKHSFRFECYEIVFGLGCSEAAFEIGHIFEFGASAVAPDPKEAVRWYRSAAKRNHVESQFRLAIMICNSDDPAVGDEGEIEHWLGKASDSGHPAAMYLLSLKMKEDGRQHDSHRMLRRAAAKRYPMAGLDLAVD